MSCGCSGDLKQQVQLKQLIKHNDEVFSFDFSNIFPLSWEAGSYSKVFVKVEGKLMGKKLSYASLPEEGMLRFTTRIKADKSPYKKALMQLKIGDFVEITLPKGKLELLRVNQPILLLSSGVGIATMRALIKAFENDANGIPEMIQINVDGSGAIFKEELDAIAEKNQNFKSLYCVDRKSFYHVMDHALQSMMMRFEEEPLVYVVGSDAFVYDLTSHLLDLGLSENQIQVEGVLGALGTCGCGPESGCGCGANLVSLVG